MSGGYWVVDETSYNVLGTFTSRGQAVDYVAALLSVNDDDLVDELTISDDTGPLLYGKALREALRRRKVAQEHTASPSCGDASSGGAKQPVEALTAKGRHA